MKGIFITFEGIEGCGKSTQAKLLKKYLENNSKKVFLTREPGGPGISEKIRSLLLDKNLTEMLPETELLLFMASRVQHTGEWIIPKLKKGEIVISDRYSDSTLAYQGGARRINQDIIKKINDFASYGLVPDITFLIDLPAETGLGRIVKSDADRLESESIEFHKNVRKEFLYAAKSAPERFVVIDGKQSVEEIHDRIVESVKNYI
ncbi:MAG: dTMP kinase [Candidatus Cloacimonadota bacterium]|nr:MAG: dTMP kinase [Candidatus Cloacimonadota bacterium]